MRVNWAASAAAIAIVAATSSNAHAQEQAPAAGATVDELLVTGGSQVTLPPAYAGGQVARCARVGLFGALDYMDTLFRHHQLHREADPQSAGAQRARTGSLDAVSPMPWYVKALSLSQPLHFGDYGGLPLKIVWGVLDVVTIVVAGSGVWLWVSRRRSQRRALAPAPAVAE